MTITAAIDVDGVVTTYTIDRETREITSDDVDESGDSIPDVVTDLLDTDELIGPQVDDFSGAIGSWDHPMNVVAAFSDAADTVGGQLYSFDISDDPLTVDGDLTNSDDIPT